MTEFAKNILKEFPYKTELHCHSANVSSCSKISLEEMTETYKENGYSGIVLTNHFYPWLSETDEDYEVYVNSYIKEYHKLRELCAKESINVYLGMEIRFEECDNDYLVYGIDEDFIRAIPRKVSTLEEFVLHSKNENNIILQAHPFRRGMVLMPNELIDGIEVYNMHPNHNSRIGYAARYAEKVGKLCTCGTDYHHPGQGALSALLTKKVPKDSFELVHCIKNEPIYMIGESIVLF